jgi:nicotinamidase/pyrazinamidase
MGKIMKILIFIVALIVFIIGLLIILEMYISKPTQGNKIEPYKDPQKAVLVIDIQEDYTGTTAKPPFPYKDSQKLITTVNTITKSASKKNIIIIYIRQELEGFWGKLLSNLIGGGTAFKGNPGTEIDKQINLISSNVFSKPRSDAFSNPKLEEFLIQHHVDELYLIGLDAAGCVHNTAKGALNRGYTINIITDSIVLMDENKWDKLIKLYKEEGIKLILSRDFINMNP